MARLDYVETAGEVADRIRARRGGRLTPLDRMLLHSPPFADGWNSLLGAIRGQGTLPGDLRELAVLRVAALNGADYEWAAHEPVARKEGMTAEQVGALRVDGDTALLDERQRAAVAYTDAMTENVSVPEEVFSALHKHFDSREIVELTVTVGAYNLVSRFLVALEVGA
ncbi:carboxymuconolactone decarboxylase family protein [Amycolatopsis sp. La24]|uniref:carboxymuconolactone decarboxylase family protein n=1 Tax=Amycolatopsis sp. La24 TaxID=3028304 RepID=UPI0023AE8848|nr:carboxymuconolactone decarboxylase family protein [Amycolatopsis sp. La24]